jgi:hypothetical protein
LPKALFVAMDPVADHATSFPKDLAFRADCRRVFSLPGGTKKGLTFRSSANSIFSISSATRITIDFEVPGSMRIIAARRSGKTGRCNPSGFPPLCRDGCQGSKLQDQAGKLVADAYPLRAEVSS